MEAKHTSGPWEMHSKRGHADINAHFRPDMPDGGYDATIATVDTRVEGGVANARLIAKAWLIPDLLAALELARTTLSNIDPARLKIHERQYRTEAIHHADKALAKAKGG